MKYERTGETTDDPCVAASWGAWYPFNSGLPHVLWGDGTLKYRRTNGSWQDVDQMFRGPYARARAVVEPKSGAELRRWLMDHPGVEVAEMDCRARWNAGAVALEWKQSSENGWVLSHPLGPHVPADGKGWDR